ncbi:uncharacterized protein LOC127251663 isoform X2 [Andrographis paniculata]|uniref:uncharacterized protein LOC127251663 isoform X2 n=1 Tax=Andrographis paniculata TaxID=175694 RepID=UPI0021E92E30|nr:uncharacterized protein LOC127251663 isoform X2 [Andrographis paniculata]
MESSDGKYLTKDSDEGFSRYSHGSANLSPPQFPKAGEWSEIVVVEPPGYLQRERKDLLVKIPTEGSMDDSVTINMPPSPIPTPKRVSFSPLPSPNHIRISGSPGPSSKGKPSVKSFLPKLSFKFRNNDAEIERAAMLALGASPEMRGKASMSRTFSLSKIFNPKVKKASSLPPSPILHSNPESTHGGVMVGTADASLGGHKLSMHRSLSVPDLNKQGSTKQMEYLGNIFRVAPRKTEWICPTSVPNAPVDADRNNNHTDIPEEEAVCRICLVELGEGTDTLKMECNCKGELALAHQQCAIKWFSIKGNKNCDVCKQEVKNLPVTLLRIQSSQSRMPGTLPQNIVQYRVWQDVPVLVIVSMLAYFCFLEQLLVMKMGSSAIAISLPFACILGLLASMTSTTMVRRKYAWIYATIQFGMVVVFAHVFYSLLHVQAVLSVLLATFAGFGGAMCGTSIFFEILKFRRARARQMPPPVDPAQPSNQAPETGNPDHTDLQLPHQNEQQNHPNDDHRVAAA